MSTTRRVIYPGTFDPITNGHLDVIGRASELFDEVIVAVATNNSKTTLFSTEERVALCREAASQTLSATNIIIDSFEGLLVDYVHRQEAVAVIRGVRAISDFDYEFQMALMNRKLEDISTIFLMPHERYTFLNSTIIRELARYGRELDEFVPSAVQRELKKKFETSKR